MVLPEPDSGNKSESCGVGYRARAVGECLGKRSFPIKHIEEKVVGICE